MKKILTLIFIIGFYACKDEIIDPARCHNYAEEFGPFLLDESTKDLFPYFNDINRLVFVDEVNREFFFELDSISTRIKKILYSSECPFDSTQQIPYQEFRENLQATFHSDSLNLGLRVIFQARANIKDAEVIGESDHFSVFIAENSHFIFTLTVSSKILNKYGTNNQFFTQFDPSLPINSRVFNDVYSSFSFFNPVWKTYFNYEFGVVGLEHVSGSPILSLDRIE